MSSSSEPLYAQNFAAFRNKTLNQTVKELADREEIRELIARYAHRIAHNVSVADLFTDDGAFLVYTPGKSAVEARGRAELDKMYGSMAGRTVQTLPMLHNYLVVISGDEATGICSLEVRASISGQSIIGSGYYDDIFRRVNGNWQFVVRSVSFFHWVTLQEGWAKS